MISGREKQGKIYGGALTEEVMNSSRSILQSARGGSHTKGLQQYFTPLEAARLIAGVFGGARAVLDPTAGAGDLLAPYREDARFGIEIDPDHAGGALDRSYAAIPGDAQNVVPMLRAAGARWPAVVLNPPFGLGWRDPAHSKKSEINSTLLAFLWAHDLLDGYGQGAIIMGTDRLATALLPRPEARGIYAVVDVAGPLFDGVRLPTSIAFFVRPENLRYGDSPEPPLRLSARREDLDDGETARVVSRRRDERVRLVTRHPSGGANGRPGIDDLRDAFDAVARENELRRKAEEQEAGARRFDLDLRGKKVRARLSPFAKLALAESGPGSRVLEHLNGQNVQYFGQNVRAWRMVKQARDAGLLTVSGALEERAEKAIVDAEKISTPLFPVKEQMRLGWLSDLDRILCIKGCPTRGFVAGESYPISTHQKLATSSEKRVVENRHGEHELRRFTTERKLLHVTVGSHSFDEGPESIAYLAEHFELPDPGCVKSRHPDEVARNRRILQEIAAENGFEFKEFQLDHLSRLLVKGRGVLAHEQGLGKCVGGDTPILVNGALVRADEAWARYAEAPDGGRFDGEGYWSEPARPLTTTALRADGRMVEARFVRLYRQKVNEWGRKVTLDDGSSITITNAHKLHNADGWTLNVKPGDSVAVPGRIAHRGRAEDRDLAELLAWQIAEGFEHLPIGLVEITQKDTDRLARLRTLALRVGTRYGLTMNSMPVTDPPNRCPHLNISSRRYRTFLESEFGYEWGKKSAEKRIPERIVAADEATIRVFLRAYLAAESSVNPKTRVVELTSASKGLMEQLSLMLRRFGIWLRVRPKQKTATNGSGTIRTYHTGLIGGTSLRRLADLVGIDDPVKDGKLQSVAAVPSNGNVESVPVADVLRQARAASGLPWLHLTPSRAYAFNSGGGSPAAARAIAEKLRETASEDAAERWRGPKGQPPKPTTMKAYENLVKDEMVRLAEHLDERAGREVYYARVVSVETVRLDGWVYDFEVEEHHNYVAGGMMAHNTLQQMAIAEAVPRIFPKARSQALFVVPQDLVDQWSREAKKFFGRELEPIRTPAEARAVARRVQGGEDGWFVTHYELLSLVGRKKTLLPVTPLPGRLALHARLHEHKERKRQRAHRTNAAPGAPHQPQRQERPPLAPTSRDACPICHATGRDGWDGESCPKCSYAHRSRYQKAGYTYLTAAFKDGIVCVDELSEIRGDDSLRSKAIRALARGAHRFGGTGTPISNYVNDAYWGLWFALGNASPAFPYDYENGKSGFESDFCVIEYLHGREEDEEEHLRKRRKVLPRITNVSQFWRLTQPSVSRCRKEDTGEPLVEKTYYPIRVPLGKAQQEMNAFWLDKFPDFFRWRNPGHPFVAQGLVEKFAAALGQLWRLETTATLPASDEPTHQWPEARKALDEPSNWTPATLKVLELAKRHAEAGEKVLIGSDLIITGRWIAERLNEKGLRATHITEEKAGKVATKNPRKRAKEVHDFVLGGTQVLCAGVQALKLGHNLDVASVVILHGLPYSYMTSEQFLDRVHRLTSKKPVSVYVVIPRNSLAERKWNLLKDKGDAADLAFDGELSVQNEEVIDWNKVLREMREQGIRASGDEVLEADVEAAWAAVPALAPPTPKLPPPPRRRQSPSRPHRPAEGTSGYVQASLF